VAFSGGADSSFLLRSALDVLGPENVVSLHARSCLQKTTEQELADSWAERHGYDPVDMQQRIVDFQPLDWKEFVANPENRCYLCKKHVYKLFLKELAHEGITVLLDGTNSDDLRQGEKGRPGLRAVAELGVRTPLADCALRKAEIRELSRESGLDTCDLPSSSCLATRIPHRMEITAERLKRIVVLEQIVIDSGFFGCRVRLENRSEKTIFLQLLHKDTDRFNSPPAGRIVIDLLKSKGIDKIFLDVDGR
jgi:uncharacterized protein